jgi:hypothetical protein
VSDATLEYPYNVFPSDVLRRVLGNLPAPHPQELIDEVNAYHAELYEGESVPPPVYPTAFSVDRLKARLDPDPHSVVHDAQGVRDYTEDEIRQALAWNVEQGFAEQGPDGEYRMTDAGLAALKE